MEMKAIVEELFSVVLESMAAVELIADKLQSMAEMMNDINATFNVIYLNNRKKTLIKTNSLKQYSSI
jgi:hypothetical protein